MVEPFRVPLDEADVADLRERLRRTRWPEAETVDDWSQGAPLAYVRELCRFWGEEYDFGFATASTPFRSSGPPSTASACTSCTSGRPNRTRCRSC